MQRFFLKTVLNIATSSSGGEGEKAIVALAKALCSGNALEGLDSIGYRRNGETVLHDIAPLCRNLDTYGYPSLGGTNIYFIHHDGITRADPQLSAVGYELSASRGCPFSCSYCSSVNLRRLYRGKGKYVRFRSVENVMEELLEAKRKMKNLRVIHFWDEIFCDDPQWVEEFAGRYKREIQLPFEIWAHPLKVREDAVRMLVDAGLYKVVMGIQSGSPRIRREVFHRTETQEDILTAAGILQRSRVPQIIYDFMLQHPFEKVEDLRDTYDLCMQFKLPFELQLHGLNFLPGTDIVNMAVREGVMEQGKVEEMMKAPLSCQYQMYWGQRFTDLRSDFWYSLIFMSQFRFTRPVARYLAEHYESISHNKLGVKLYKRAKLLSRVKYFYKKGGLLVRSVKSGHGL